MPCNDRLATQFDDSDQPTPQPTWLRANRRQLIVGTSAARPPRSPRWPSIANCCQELYAAHRIEHRGSGTQPDSRQLAEGRRQLPRCPRAPCTRSMWARWSDSCNVRVAM